MEEESWASCGNSDYLTPWDLSFLSTKSSLMLSMMLGVEGEDGPSCNSWSPSLMCMNIIFNVSSPLLPQFSFNFFLYKVMVPIIASRRHRLLQFLVVPLLPHLHEFFFQFPEQNVYWNIAPLRSARIFSFQRVLIRPKLIPNKRVMSISSQCCNLSRWISKGQLDPCHSNFLKLDFMLKSMPLSGMIFNMKPKFTELWWHESNFP